MFYQFSWFFGNKIWNQREISVLMMVSNQKKTCFWKNTIFWTWCQKLRHEILMILHRVSGPYDLMEPSYDQITVSQALAKLWGPFSEPNVHFLSVLQWFLTVFAKIVKVTTPLGAGPMHRDHLMRSRSTIVWEVCMSSLCGDCRFWRTPQSEQVGQVFKNK